MNKHLNLWISRLHFLAALFPTMSSKLGQNAHFVNHFAK